MIREVNRKIIKDLSDSRKAIDQIHGNENVVFLLSCNTVVLHVHHGVLGLTRNLQRNRVSLPAPAAGWRINRITGTMENERRER